MSELAMAIIMLRAKGTNRLDDQILQRFNLLSGHPKSWHIRGYSSSYLFLMAAAPNF